MVGGLVHVIETAALIVKGGTSLIPAVFSGSMLNLLIFFFWHVGVLGLVKKDLVVVNFFQISRLCIRRVLIRLKVNQGLILVSRLTTFSTLKHRRPVAMLGHTVVTVTI